MYTLEEVKANMQKEFGDEVQVITTEEANYIFGTNLKEGTSFNKACKKIEARNSVFYADGDPNSIFEALEDEPHMKGEVDVYFLYDQGFAIGILN